VETVFLRLLIHLTRRGWVKTPIFFSVTNVLLQSIGSLLQVHLALLMQHLGSFIPTGVIRL